MLTFQIICLVISSCCFGLILEKLILKYTNWHKLFNDEPAFLVFLSCIWPITLIATIFGIIFLKIGNKLFKRN